jgi:hypothetical protein
MTVHKRVGLVFAVFCLVLLAWNIATPSNEDHVLNIIEHSILSLLFIISVIIDNKVSRYIQIAALFVGSGITAISGDLQPASAVSTVAVIMAYVYWKFQTFNVYFLISVSVAQFIFSLTASIISGYTPLISTGHSVIWSAVPFVCVWLGWTIMRQFSEDVIKQNRDLLEINKELMEERNVSKRA